MAAAADPSRVEGDSWLGDAVRGRLLGMGVSTGEEDTWELCRGIRDG
jgi:hypothetical protein